MNNMLIFKIKYCYQPSLIKINNLFYINKIIQLVYIYYYILFTFYHF